ncbi:hypothetical protein [Burkholderia ubonensis]|uniref:hypothetical protein n=1 Tax=Burkholderia ubonensis TaxID=101571 RepID=UPI0012FB46C1|nr:hypothetical protein [Burkholderia ubonensis]
MGDARQATCVERNGQIAGWRQARIAAGAGWTAETAAHYFIKIKVSFLINALGCPARKLAFFKSSSPPSLPHSDFAYVLFLGWSVFFPRNAAKAVSTVFVAVSA